MKLKRLIFFIAFLLLGISCYANDGGQGFPKAWEKWRAKVENDSGKVIAYSVKRNWVLYSKHHLSVEESLWVRNMRKKKETIVPYLVFNFALSALPIVNIDTCKTNYTIRLSLYNRFHISPDGRAIVKETFDNYGGAYIEYFSLETGKSKELTFNAYKEEEGTIGFDSDSTFYTWEEVFCDKKGKVVESFEQGTGLSTAELIGFVYSGLVYKDYYRKVRYNTKGKKLSVGKLVSSRKMQEEDCRISNNPNNILYLLSWEPKLYNKNGVEARDSTGRIIDLWCVEDSLLNHGVYTYYYHRQDKWTEATSSSPSNRYTREAVLFLEKHRWGNQNEVPQELIYEDEKNYYRWMPVMCDAQGRIASDNVIFPDDPESYSIESKIIVAKDVEEALRAGKIQYLYRRMWYKYYDQYLGCDSKLYTKDEVVAIEKNNFHWPDTW